MEESESISLWVDYVVEDSSTPEGKARKDGLWAIVREQLSQSEVRLIEVYLEEENTGKRHWELDPNDTNIYLEWLYGTNKLRNLVHRKVESKSNKEEQNIPTREQLQEFQQKHGNPNIRRQPFSKSIHRRR